MRSRDGGAVDDTAGEPAVRVVHDMTRSRFEVHVDDRLAGFAEYRLDDGAIAFTHTETDPRLRGHGLAAHAVRAGLDEARTRRLAVLPYCWYVRNWIAAHPEYLPSVPADRCAEFGLGGAADELSTARRDRRTR